MTWVDSLDFDRIRQAFWRIVPFRCKQLAFNRPWTAGPGFTELPPSPPVIGLSLGSRKVEAVAKTLDEADARCSSTPAGRTTLPVH